MKTSDSKVYVGKSYGHLSVKSKKECQTGYIILCVCAWRRRRRRSV